MRALPPRCAWQRRWDSPPPAHAQPLIPSQLFVVQAQALQDAASHASQAVTFARATLDLAPYALQLGGDTHVTLQLSDHADGPALTLALQYTLVRVVQPVEGAVEGEACDSSDESFGECEEEFCPEASTAAAAGAFPEASLELAPSGMTARTTLGESVRALSQRVLSLEQELREARASSDARALALEAAQQQVTSSREEARNAGEVKGALQDYAGLLELELEALRGGAAAPQASAAAARAPQPAAATPSGAREPLREAAAKDAILPSAPPATLASLREQLAEAQAQTAVARSDAAAARAAASAASAVCAEAHAASLSATADALSACSIKAQGLQVELAALREQQASRQAHASPAPPATDAVKDALRAAVARVAATDAQLSAALARAASAEQALTASDAALCAARTATAQLEAAAAIREAREAAGAAAAAEVEDGQAKDDALMVGIAAALEAELAQARAQAESARADARSLAGKLSSARAATREAQNKVATAAAGSAGGGSESTAEPSDEAAEAARLRRELSSCQAALAASVAGGEGDAAAAAVLFADVCEQLEARTDEALSLKSDLAQALSSVAASALARKALTKSQARVAELEAENAALQARLLEAQADIRAANTAATSAHMRASAAAAAAAAVRGAADDADEDDEGETVPAAKARRLEAALDVANHQLRLVLERRERQNSAVTAEFAAQYELRQRAEAMLLQQLAQREQAQAQAEALLSTAQAELQTATASLEALRSEVLSGIGEAQRGELARAEERVAHARAQTAEVASARDELESLLQAHLNELVAAKLEAAELQGRILELCREVQAGRAKVERLGAKLTALEVVHYASASERTSADGAAVPPA